MKIVFAHDHKFREINNVYYSTGGLSDKVLTRYTDIFENVKVIARVVSKQKGDKGLTKITNSRVDIINTERGIKGSKDIEKHIRECDALIARLPSLIGNSAIHFAKKYKKPYMIEMVGCSWDSLWNHSSLGKLVAPYLFFKTKSLIKNSPYTLYVTKEFLQRRYPSNGIGIGCSDVELKYVDNSILEERLKKIEYSSNSNEAIIGTIAAVNVKYKGQEYIIESISKLNKEGYNFEYEIVGGGDNSYLKSIAQKFDVRNKVRFLGTLPHEKVFDWIKTIDIYAQPSKQEGLPRALVEAMSMGCPSIGSKTGGIPELLNSEFIFNNGDINEICEFLKKLDKDAKLIEARRSFNKASEYNYIDLDEKRNAFYKEFELYAKGKKQ